MAINCYSLVVTYNNAGQFAQNVFKYKLDDTGFTDMATAAKALCTAWIAAPMGALQIMLPASVQLLSVKARAIDTVGGFESITPLPGSTLGLRVGQVQASGVCPCLVWFPNGNSKTRGKTFLPSVTDNDLIDGTFQTGYRNAINAQIPNLVAPLILVGGGSPTATFVIRQTKPTYSLLGVQYGNLVDIAGTLRKRMRPY